MERKSSLKTWEETQKTVTLTNAEWNKLTVFVHLSTNYRKNELDSWTRLAKEKNEDGTPTFKNAEDNARFWKETIEEIDRIIAIIDGMY